MNAIYDKPKYYELAFSFRNISSEVDVFEQTIKKYSHIPVKNMLELGCGNSPHMLELIKRSYWYTGLDVNEEMLNYSRLKAKKYDEKVNLVNANMIDFSLKRTFDFVYIMLGSLYVQNTEQLLDHFRSVSKVLKNGGLYFLDWCVDFTPLTEVRDSWVVEKGNITVHAQYSTKIIDVVEQTFKETVQLHIDDNGTHITLSDSGVRRAIYPQEFLMLLKLVGDFEFIGWWNDWDFNSSLHCVNEVSRPIIVIRKRT